MSPVWIAIGYVCAYLIGAMSVIVALVLSARARVVRSTVTARPERWARENAEAAPWN